MKIRPDAWYPFLLLVAGACGSVAESPEPPDPDRAAAIERVLRRAYVDGVFRRRDPDLVRDGFAPTFVMQVYWDEKLSNRPLEQWLQKMKLDRKPSSRVTEARVRVLDITGVAAVARVDFWFDGVLSYTDYFGLYDTTAGWKIVSKFFHGYRASD